MHETLYAEVDLSGAVVDMVKQCHCSGVSVAVFGPTHPSNTKPGHHYLPNRRDKTEHPAPSCAGSAHRDRQADTLPPDDPDEEARWRTAAQK